MSEEIERRGLLGRIGEELALQALERNGFYSVRPLRTGHEYADVYAERDGKRYAISVKARNKWEKPARPNVKPQLNRRYKLGNAKNCLDLARRAEEAHDASAAWLAIALERETYDAYFGTLEMLRQIRVKGRALNGKGVMMTPEYLGHYECLAKRAPHNLDYDYLKNLPKGTAPPT